MRLQQLLPLLNSQGGGGGGGGGNSLEETILAQSTNLIYYYKMDDPVDPPTTDYYNQGSAAPALVAISGADIGQGLLGPDGQSYALWDDDRSGQCELQFSEPASYSVPTNRTSDITFTFMIKFADVGIASNVVGKNKTSSTTREYDLSRDTSNRLYLRDWNTAGAVHRSQLTAAFTAADTWYHVAFKLYNTSATPDIYVDGVLANDTEVGPVGTRTTTATNAPTIGRFRTDFTQDNGGIQVTHIAIWNTSKSGAEIATIAAAAASDGWI